MFNFDMAIAEESKDWIDKQNQYAMWEKGPLMVYLKPRLQKM
jgi:hypothetical protein